MATGIEESKTDTITTSGTGAMLLSSEQPDTKVPVPKLERISKGTDIDTKDDAKNPEKLTNGAVDKITTYLKDLNKTSSNQNANTSTAVERFKSIFAKKFEEVKGEVDAETDAKLKQEKEDAFYDKCNNVIDLSQSILDNLDDLTGDDPLKCITSTLDVIGTAAELFGGPVQGVIVSTVCGIVSSIISMFGGDDTKGSQSLSEVLGAVVKQALNEFKDESINENFQGAILEGKMTISVLNGIASYNGGKLTHESEETILTSLDYARIGLPLMGQLQYQISKYYTDNTDEHKKAQYLPKYLYYYCVIFQMKRILLTLQCNLLRSNGLESAFCGIDRYLNNSMVKDAYEFLSFLEEAPQIRMKSEDMPFWTWSRFYRNIHDPTVLNQGERKIISKTLDVCGITMPGQLIKLRNIAGGDACVVDKKDDRIRILPGSTFRHAVNPEYDTSFKINDFKPMCNLFRKFKKEEITSKNIDMPPDYDGFILFSIKHLCFVEINTTMKINPLHGGVPSSGSRAMIFKNEGDVLIGGFTRYLYHWYEETKPVKTGYSFKHGSFKSTFGCEENSGDGDKFHWNLIDCKYGEYFYLQDTYFFDERKDRAHPENCINIQIGNVI